MSLSIKLLGPPGVVGVSPQYQVRSRKSWALLTCLLLGERAWSRSQLASMLFDDADDPLRALRWNLSEVRRALGPDASIEGDPVVLTLPAGTTVDVEVLSSGTWAQAVRLPGLGEDLLDGHRVRAAPAYEAWLLLQQRHVAASTEAVLHEAALGSLSRGQLQDAIGFAVRALQLAPLDENHHALVIRLYRLLGDTEAAQRQYDQCAEVLQRELGLEPGPPVHQALREVARGHETAAGGAAAVRAVIEAGLAAVGAGAIQAGVDSLRTAVHLADADGAVALRVESRLPLAEALVHSLRGFDEEGLAHLHEVDALGLASGDREVVARARAELGYVDFLRGRYDRSRRWLAEALSFADDDWGVVAKAESYLGSVESDCGNHELALTHLERSRIAAQKVDAGRTLAYVLSMEGRVHLLRGELDLACAALDASTSAAEAERWLSFLPWPQSLRGEVALAAGEPSTARVLLEQAFARACQLGDPCWEGHAARALALVADAEGRTEDAIEILLDARGRCNRLADPYVWLDAYILDALCEIGAREGRPEVRQWLETMQRLASRCGMRDLSVRALRHGATLGDEGAAVAADLLAARAAGPER